MTTHSSQCLLILLIRLRHKFVPCQTGQRYVLSCIVRTLHGCSCGTSTKKPSLMALAIHSSASTTRTCIQSRCSDAPKAQGTRAAFRRLLRRQGAHLKQQSYRVSLTSRAICGSIEGKRPYLCRSTSISRAHVLDRRSHSDLRILKWNSQAINLDNLRSGVLPLIVMNRK
jgi:hypothetical protein